MARMSFAITAVFAAFLAIPGCGDVDPALRELSGRNPPEASIKGGPGDAADGSSGAETGDAILIGSFNIQVFGESKIENQRVAEILAKVVRRFDVVAIQEVRAKATDFIPYFVRIVNSDGSQYDSVVGPRLGRTNSKEQYAFLFDTRRIEVARKSVYTVDDPHDLLHREPLVARFRVKGVPAQEAFTFSLVNIHTDPDETDVELDALDDVFRIVQNDGAGEDDVILLGDLNVDERKFGELGRVPGIQWAISGLKTNTRQTHAYDNILFDRRATAEFTGRSGIFDLKTEYGLSLEEALQVSDHFPVWAEFGVREAGARRVAQEAR